MTETEHLLVRVAQGDGEAVEACMATYGNLVWALTRRLIGRHMDADDAVQEIFVEIWKSAPRFDPAKGTEAQFIATIARRRLIDRIRRKARRPAPQPLGELAHNIPGAKDESVDVRDDAARAQAAVARLRPEQQQVLRLSIERGLTHEEISTEIAMPLGTVKTHLRRGLIKLRELLGADGKPDDDEPGRG